MPGEGDPEQPQVENKVQQETSSKERNRRPADRVKAIVSKRAAFLRGTLSALKNAATENPLENNDTIRAANLTPDELEASGIPNGHLRGAEVGFKGKSGQDYTIHYNYSSDTSRYGTAVVAGVVSLTARNEEGKPIPISDKQEAEEAIRKIKELNNDYLDLDPDYPPGMKVDQNTDLSRGIRLKPPPGQAALAGLVRRYNEVFQEVGGINVSYGHLNKYRARETNLPPDKLVYNKQPYKYLESTPERKRDMSRRRYQYPSE